jgi:hypothetical protein
MIEVKPRVYFIEGMDVDGPYWSLSFDDADPTRRPLYDQSTIDALQARIAELEKDAGRLRKHIQQVAETHEEMRVKWHKLSLTPFDTEENKTIVLQRVKEQKLLRDIHLAAIAKENNG